MISKSISENTVDQFSHQLKNSLTIIRLNLSQIKNKDKKSASYIGKIDKKIEDIAKDLARFRKKMRGK